MPQVIQKSLKDAALEIIRENCQSDPALGDVYLFPSEDEIRLIYLDPNTTRQNSEDIYISPFYFGRDVQGGLDYRSAFALIHPDERVKLLPPKSWGTWNEAEIIKE